MRPGLKPGSIVDGKYRVERVIGAGGMGMVVAATHLGLRQPVALKFIVDPRDGGDVERFLREARATARLESPHVCRVMDVSVQDGSPYIVMELLKGTDLAHHLIAFGPPTWMQAVSWVREMLEGLEEAHRNGIVHRDLKPANLFLAQRADRPSIVKILDFGISKLQNTESLGEIVTGKTGVDLAAAGPPSSPTSLTGTGMTMGTPPYMSPEQLRASKEVDARCDVWATGCILYELVSGKRAFPGAIPKVADLLAGRYTPLREVAPHAPVELERIIARCLAVDLGERYASAAELSAALLELLRLGDALPETLPTPAAVAQATGAANGDPSPAAAPLAGGSTPDGVVVRSNVESTRTTTLARALPIVAALCLLAVVLAVAGTWSRRSPAAAGLTPTPAAPATSEIAAATPAAAAPAAVPEPAAVSPAASAASSAPARAAATSPASRPRVRRAKPASSGGDIDLGRL